MNLKHNTIFEPCLHLKSDARVHGIITDGGKAINVIPAYAAAQFSVRAATRVYLEEITARVNALLQTLIDKIHHISTILTAEGRAAILERFTAASSYVLGKRVVVELPEGEVPG